MADKALRLDLELNLINEERLEQQISQRLKDTQLSTQHKDNDERSNIERFYDMSTKLLNSFRGVYTGDNKQVKAGLGLLNQGKTETDKISNDIMKIMKTGVGIIEDIHTRIKSASPLLQSVESLFNLAVQLFFMPLGNKLATVMIPAIMELVDGVMEMWQKIEGMDLGEILTEMINYGAKIFGDFFNNLGEELASQTGLVGSIGEILIALGDFIENHMADLLGTVLEVLKWIFANLGTLVDAFIEFKILSLSLQAAQVGAAIGGAFGPIGSAIGAGIGLGAGEIGGHYVKKEAGVQSMVDAMPRAASGAYVGATEGGRSVTVAEGGEGEFILPESRLQSMMGSISDRMVDVAQSQNSKTHTDKESSSVINNNFYITGYTDRELVSLIKSTVNEQVSQSRLRSGF